ncbi:MAG: glycosyltransferase family 2 protein [Candidatus Dojkabacteria bacterium]
MPADKRSRKGSLISLVAPVYNEQGGIEKFRERMVGAMEKAKIDFELIFINDGSKDDSLLLLLQMAQKDKRIKVINFSRNFGHQIAVSAGMDYASGDAAVIIDADLQDPPEVVPDLVARWEDGYEVVNALRKTRQDSIFKKFTADMFYHGLNMLLSYKIPENVGDFRLLDRRPLDTIKRMRERDRYIRGMTNWIGFDQTLVGYDRDKRFAGKSGYPLKKMLALASNALFSFSNFPLKMAHLAFATFFCLAILVSIYAVLMKLGGFNVPGWTFQVLITVLFGTIQMFVLAIISEYVGRSYRQGQDRPLYIVSDTTNLEEKKST